MRLEGLKHTNPIAVGDKVEVELEPNQDSGIISQVLPRENYIIRKASNLSKQTHIIASNMQQAVLVVSIVNPTTSLGFVDRFLVTAEAYHIKSILVFNKVDLCVGPIEAILDETIQIYSQIGYTCIKTSVPNQVGLNQLVNELKDKTTLVAGHSGVGKSTLLNTISPGLNLKTGEISSFSSKGKHTTTFAEMFELSFGGNIIDTPGIKELGLVELEPSEVGQYFVEFNPLSLSCKYNNCLHINEPQCAIKLAVTSGQITSERYHSYCNMLTKSDLYQ